MSAENIRKGAGLSLGRRPDAAASPFNREAEQYPRSLQLATAIDEIIQDQFSEPDLWSRDGNWRMVDSISFGVSTRNDYTGTDADRWFLTQPKKAWIAGIYGARVVQNSVETIRDKVTLETVDLPTLIAMQHTFADTILSGEGSRPAVLIDPPYPNQGDDHPLNNDKWLEALRDGRAPVMKDARDPLGNYGYSPHDLGVHLGNLMLFPKEVQELITEATGHELHWRQQFPWRLRPGLMNNKTKHLLLPGETPETEDQWSHIGDVSDGVEKLDRLTDVVSYTDLLAYLVANPEQDAHERLLELREDTDNPDLMLDDSLHKSSIRAITHIPKVLADVVNFNTRHREGRNTTQEEVDAVVDSFFNGLLRVANKIRGVDLSKEADVTVGAAEIYDIGSDIPRAEPNVGETVNQSIADQENGRHNNNFVAELRKGKTR